MCNPRSFQYSRPGLRHLYPVVLALVVALGVPLRGTSWAQPVGSEFQVNTYTTGYQKWTAVAADANGNFVVVWHSYSQDGSGEAVLGQRYTSAGAAVGTEFQVNTYTTFDQVYPAVAADADGDFVVVWGSYGDGDNYGVFGRRYTSAGAAVGTEFQVNTYTPDNQWLPAVAAEPDGDFVVVWQSDFQDGGFTGTGIFGQRYTSAGAAIGAEFQVNTYTTSAQYFPAVTADADGDFVVVWTSQGQGALFGVFGQRYTSAGAAAGAEFQLSTGPPGIVRRAPAVAADPDGDFVAVWGSDGDGSAFGVFGQRYTSAGAAVGTEFQVNTYTTLAQRFPAVTADADGDFVVVWESVYQEAGDGFTGVFGQRYTSAGATVGAEFQVNTYTTNSQAYPAVAADANGNFVVVWESYSQDGSNRGIFGDQFQFIVPTTTTSTTTTTTLPPSIPTLSGGAHLLLATLLAFAMFVLGLAWRLNSRAG